jgi:hypothetical protein
VSTEADRLRERIDQLEREHTEEIARLQRALATAQERVYWLDRWHIDLNRWMATRWGEAFRAVLRAVRAPIRAARLAQRKLRAR